MMNALFEAIAEREEADRQVAENQWRAVIRKIVAGTATEREVTATLKATGRSLADLQRDIDFQVSVEQLYVTLATWPTVDAAAQKAEAAFQAFCLRRQENFRSERDECAVLTAAVLTAQNAVEVVAAAKRDLEELLQEPISFPDVPNELADVVLINE